MGRAETHWQESVFFLNSIVPFSVDYMTSVGHSSPTCCELGQWVTVNWQTTYLPVLILNLFGPHWGVGVEGHGVEPCLKSGDTPIKFFRKNKNRQETKWVFECTCMYAPVWFHQVCCEVTLIYLLNGLMFWGMIKVNVLSKWQQTLCEKYINTLMKHLKFIRVCHQTLINIFNSNILQFLVWTSIFMILLYLFPILFLN